MPRLIHLNHHCGLEPGGDLADALDKANAIAAESAIKFGYSRQPLCVVKASPPPPRKPDADPEKEPPDYYTLTRDAGLDAAGTHYDLPITVVPTRGASLWVGSPNQDYTAHWVDGPLSTGVRKSFRSRVGGQAAILKNHEALAALDEQHDWTSARSFTLDLSLGRAVPFVGEWHGILGHEEDSGSLSAPMVMRTWRGSNGVDTVGLDVRLESGPRGERFSDEWRFSVPGFCGTFDRMDLRLVYTVGLGLRAWVNGVAVTTRRITRREQVPWPIADNRQLGAFTFPWVQGTEPVVDLTLHALSLTAQTAVRSVGCTWSMEPEQEGRAFASRTRGRLDGWSRTRAFRVGPVEAPFARAGIGMVKGVRVSRMSFLNEAPDSTGAWMTPIRFGWSLGNHIDHVSAPDGCFSLVDNYGISTYPVVIRDCETHHAHTAIVARMLTLSVDGLHVPYWGRSLVRSVKGGGLRLTNAMGANGGHTVAAVVADLWDGRSHFDVSGLLNDNEEEAPGCPSLYVTSKRQTSVRLSGVEWNKARGAPPHLVHIDRRRSGVNPVSIEAGACFGDLAGLVRVDGEPGQVTTWTEGDMGVLKETAESLNKEVGEVKAALVDAIARFDETVADVPHALQAMNDARASLATVKQALDGVAATPST